MKASLFNRFRIGQSDLSTALLWTATVCILLAICLLGIIVLHQVTAFDQSVFAWVWSLRNPALTPTVISITRLGDAPVRLGIGLIVAAYFIRKKRYPEAVLIAVCFLGVGLLNDWLKEIFHRIRPSGIWLSKASGYSFPSGHTMGSTAGYGLLGLIFSKSAQSRKSSIAIITTTIFIVLCIGLSRIYLGVHYPSDVLGGLIFGILWLLISAGFASLLHFDRH